MTLNAKTNQQQQQKRIPIKRSHFYGQLNILVIHQSMKRYLVHFLYSQKDVRTSAVGCAMVQFFPKETFGKLVFIGVVLETKSTSS